MHEWFDVVVFPQTPCCTPLSFLHTHNSARDRINEMVYYDAGMHSFRAQRSNVSGSIAGRAESRRLNASWLALTTQVQRSRDAASTPERKDQRQRRRHCRFPGPVVMLVLQPRHGRDGERRGWGCISEPGRVEFLANALDAR